MWKEFREFAMQGNVMDLAVAVIIGGAFGKIVASLVDNILTPIVGLILGRINLSNLFFNLSGGSAATIEEAKKAGQATLNYGMFLQSIIDFLIIAFCIFLIVRALNRLKKAPSPADPTTKECPFCTSTIPIKASRCPLCTSELTPA
jgi:large conductance mechanosensitive channel